MSTGSIVNALLAGFVERRGFLTGIAETTLQTQTRNIVKLLQKPPGLSFTDKPVGVVWVQLAPGGCHADGGGEAPQYQWPQYFKFGFIQRADRFVPCDQLLCHRDGIVLVHHQVRQANRQLTDSGVVTAIAKIQQADDFIAIDQNVFRVGISMNELPIYMINISGIYIRVLLIRPAQKFYLFRLGKPPDIVAML